ncbi:helix-turn-helix transcriptional regulator [Staphylococcus delphini]|uniref:helix-turn-helix domain-containing protein n=1 Tax=Staphylococcus delphini TaxID=53344 RepID=UPI0021D1A589|nr:helix-turn-helix transcriptional regulator [Staphylococcus delphini]UXS36825.1 helix-turn-helix transcriptional regulator [Staphylococcus delphini]
MKNIGEVLKSERLNKNISLKTIAEITKKSSPYVSMVENNKTQPSSDFLYDYSKALFHNFEEYAFYKDFIAEKYIYFCILGDIEIKFYPEVEKQLKNRGFIDERYKLTKPFYNLNWLLEENDNNLTFGFVDSNDFNYNNIDKWSVENIRAISSFDFFNLRPKVFINLDKDDKKFISQVISNYLVSKYKKQFIDEIKKDDNDLISEIIHENPSDELIESENISIGNDDKIYLHSIHDLLSKDKDKSYTSHTIRKGWKVHNYTDYDLFFDEQHIDLIHAIDDNATSFSIIGQMTYKEDKNTLNDFKIEFPEEYDIDISHSDKIINISKKNTP